MPGFTPSIFQSEPASKLVKRHLPVELDVAATSASVEYLLGSVISSLPLPEVGVNPLDGTHLV